MKQKVKVLLKCSNCGKLEEYKKAKEEWTVDRFNNPICTECVKEDKDI